MQTNGRIHPLNFSREIFLTLDWLCEYLAIRFSYTYTYLLKVFLDQHFDQGLRNNPSTLNLWDLKWWRCRECVNVRQESDTFLACNWSSDPIMAFYWSKLDKSICPTTLDLLTIDNCHLLTVVLSVVLECVVRAATIWLFYDIWHHLLLLTML